MPIFISFTYFEKNRHFGAAEVNQHIRFKNQQLLKYSQAKIILRRDIHIVLLFTACPSDKN